MKLFPRTAIGILRVLLVFLVPVLVAWWVMVRMPGKSAAGGLPTLSAEEMALRNELRADVEKLAGEIGERNVEHYDRLVAAADFIAGSFQRAGLEPRRDGYELAGRLCENIEVEIPGAAPGIFVVGAHYDSVFGSPGANDNGSGVAAVLALARRFANARPEGRQTLRFVAFTNEEPFFFQTKQMGSAVYASRCKARGDRITGMISLETIGYYSNEPGSQKFPVGALALAYPKTGNFIAFVSNVSSRRLLREALGSFRKHATLPSEGGALPASIPGVGWSDHWAFWQEGYPAIMLTDTAPFRYPHYHEASDTPDKLDYDSMARLVAGMEKTLRDLTRRAP